MAMRAKDLQGNISRRSFLASSAGAGLVMGLGVVLPGCSREQAAEEMAVDGASLSFSPAVWFEVDGNGKVLVNIAKAEMGQHVGTALARIVADELGANWDDVSIEHVDSDPKWGYMVTGASWSVFTSFTMLSQAGAAGRTILRDAGAALLGASPEDATVDNGMVSANGESVSFAEIVVQRRRTRRDAREGAVGAYADRQADAGAGRSGQVGRRRAIRHRRGTRRHGVRASADPADALRQHDSQRG
jgi:CO/xanthine dehydrogenase Mo-binding subunit